MAKKRVIDRTYLKQTIGQNQPRGQVGKSQVFQRCDPRFSNCRDIGRPDLMVREYVVPDDPQTPGQIRQRARFRAAISAWNALSPRQKAEYNERAKSKKPLTGYALFVQEYLRDSQKQAGAPPAKAEKPAAKR